MILRLGFSPLIIIIILATGGLLYFVFRGTVENLISLLTGFGLGLVPKFLPHSIEEKIKSNDKFWRFLRLYDPLRGKPEFESNGMRYYKLQSQLPDFKTIMEVKGLKEMHILGLTSEPLLKNSYNRIQKSIEAGIKFNFLILNPKSSHIKIQSENFKAGEDLEYQINKALGLLSKIKANLPDNFKNNLTVKLYDKQIGQGIMIAYSDKESWIKTTIYVIGSDSDCRPSMAGYLADNKKFYTENEKEFNKIWNLNNTILYNN